MITSPEPVTGIGERAVWGEDAGEPLGGRHVFSGPYYLIIKVHTEKKTAGLSRQINGR